VRGRLDDIGRDEAPVMAGDLGALAGDPDGDRRDADRDPPPDERGRDRVVDAGGPDERIPADPGLEVEVGVGQRIRERVQEPPLDRPTVADPGPVRRRVRRAATSVAQMSCWPWRSSSESNDRAGRKLVSR